MRPDGKTRGRDSWTSLSAPPGSDTFRDMMAACDGLETLRAADLPNPIAEASP